MPPELRPPPRRVRLRRERRLYAFLILLVAVVVDLLGLLGVFYALIDPFFVRYIPPRPATITHLEMRYGGKRNATKLYHVSYSYVLAGPRTANEVVDRELYRSLHVGQTIQVCAVRLGPLHYVEMKNGTSLSDLVWDGVGGLTWNGGVIFIVYILLVLPGRLVRIGQSAPGRTTGKKVDEGKNGTSYRIQYGFQTPDGKPHDHEISVARRVFDRAVVDANVVVLYLLRPNGSCVSTVYEFCGYVAF